MTVVTEVRREGLDMFPSSVPLHLEDFAATTAAWQKAHGTYRRSELLGWTGLVMSTPFILSSTCLDASLPPA